MLTNQFCTVKCECESDSLNTMFRLRHDDAENRNQRVHRILAAYGYGENQSAVPFRDYATYISCHECNGAVFDSVNGGKQSNVVVNLLSYDILNPMNKYISPW